MLSALQQRAPLGDVATRGNLQGRVGRVLREPSNALSLLQDAIDATVKPNPLEFRPLGKCAKREDEAIGERSAQQLRETTCRRDRRTRAAEPSRFRGGPERLRQRCPKVRRRRWRCTSVDRGARGFSHQWIGVCESSVRLRDRRGSGTCGSGVGSRGSWSAGHAVS